jgi:hypothetical protein
MTIRNSNVVRVLINSYSNRADLRLVYIDQLLSPEIGLVSKSLGSSLHNQPPLVGVSLCILKGSHLGMPTFQLKQPYVTPCYSRYPRYQQHNLPVLIRCLQRARDLKYFEPGSSEMLIHRCDWARHSKSWPWFFLVMASAINHYALDSDSAYSPQRRAMLLYLEIEPHEPVCPIRAQPDSLALPFHCLMNPVAHFYSAAVPSVAIYETKILLSNTFKTLGGYAMDDGPRFKYKDQFEGTE